MTGGCRDPGAPPSTEPRARPPHQIQTTQAWTRAPARDVQLLARERPGVPGASGRGLGDLRPRQGGRALCGHSTSDAHTAEGAPGEVARPWERCLGQGRDTDPGSVPPAREAPAGRVDQACSPRGRRTPATCPNCGTAPAPPLCSPTSPRGWELPGSAGGQRGHEAASDGWGAGSGVGC